MAARAVRRLAEALLALLAAGAVVAAETPAPTPLERLLQARLLDRYFLLLADVKVQQEQTRNVVSTMLPRRRPESRIRPITVVTPDGVFYAADYRQAEQFALEVRSGVMVNAHDKPELVIAPNQQPSIGDVVEVEREAVVALRGGDLARVTGAEETEYGTRLSLEGLSTGTVPVLLRDPEGPRGAPEERAARSLAILGRLVYLLPEDQDERRGRIDPSWSAEQQQAVREGRVLVGMTPLQVLLAWGNPLHVSRDAEGNVDVWLYKRGGTLLEQLRSRTDVYFAAGKVAQVGEDRPEAQR